MDMPTNIMDFTYSAVNLKHFRQIVYMYRRRCMVSTRLQKTYIIYTIHELKISRFLYIKMHLKRGL